MENECTIQEIPEQPSLCLHLRISPREFEPAFAAGFGRIIAQLRSQQIDVGRMYVRFSEMDQAKWDVEIGVTTTKVVPPFQDMVPSCIPACRAASTLHRGKARDMESVFYRLRQWMLAHEYIPSAYVYEIFMDDPRGKRPDEIYAGMMIPLREG